METPERLGTPWPDADVFCSRAAAHDDARDKHEPARHRTRPHADNRATPLDRQGRPRFHGAFTGGFSAGYFNTVGSEQGWAPREWTSETRRGSLPSQRAEDYMDDEDLEELRADASLSVRGEYELESDDTPRAAAADRGPTLNSLLGLFEGAQRVGEVLMRRMGWREGFGVGPREKRRAEALAAPEGVTLAPPPVASLVAVAPKSSRQGVGYVSGGDGGGGACLQAAPPRARDTVDDEIWEPYGCDSIAMYDTVLDGSGDDDGDEAGSDGDVAAEAGRKGGAASRLLVEGFVESHHPLVRSEWFEAPRVPDSFREHHVFPPSPSAATPEELTTLLGETPAADPSAVAPAGDVWALVKSRDIVRIWSELQRLREIATAPAPLQPLPPQPLPRRVYHLPGESSRRYAANSGKQARFERFLELSAEGRAVADDESLEFARVAAYYSRGDSCAGLLQQRFAPAGDAEAATRAASTEQPPLSDAEAAARAGLFGRQTRSIEPWAPDPLLCKRLGVPPPPNATPQGPEKPAWQSSMTYNDELLGLTRGDTGDGGPGEAAQPLPLRPPPPPPPLPQPPRSLSSPPAAVAARRLLGSLFPSFAPLIADSPVDGDAAARADVRPPRALHRAIFGGSDGEEMLEEAATGLVCARAAQPPRLMPADPPVTRASGSGGAESAASGRRQADCSSSATSGDESVAEPERGQGSEVVDGERRDKKRKRKRRHGPSHRGERYERSSHREGGRSSKKTRHRERTSASDGDEGVGGGRKKKRHKRHETRENLGLDRVRTTE